MVRLISLILMLIGAFTVFSWFATPASSQEANSDRVTIEVATTGAHPAGKSWDGTRVFLVPWEMTTVTPPDLDLCVVTMEWIQCAMGDSEYPVCPDADRCKFEAVAVPKAEPFGIVVFDVDNFGAEVLDATAQAAEGASHLFGQIQEDDVASVVGDEAAAWIKQGSDIAGRFANDTAATLEGADGKAREWIDAMIFLPDDEVRSPSDEEALSDRMRDLIAENAPISLMASWKNRMRGRFETETVLDCSWPSPPCEAAYATIHLFSQD